MVSQNAKYAGYIAGRTIKPMLPASLLCIRHTVHCAFKEISGLTKINTNANVFFLEDLPVLGSPLYVDVH